MLPDFSRHASNTPSIPGCQGRHEAEIGGIKWCLLAGKRESDSGGGGGPGGGEREREMGEGVGGGGWNKYMVDWGWGREEMGEGKRRGGKGR